MADDETTVKVIFEADTTPLEDALKKTQREAQKIAQKSAGFDKKALDTGAELRKEAARTGKFNTESFNKSLKAQGIEVKQLNTQKQQFKVQTTQGKLFTQQNKLRGGGLVLSNKLLKNEQGIVKAQTVSLARQKQSAAEMKKIQATWKQGQAAYGDLQTSRRASAAAMQQHIGGGWRPPPGSPEAEEKEERKKDSNIGPMVRQVAAVVASAVKQLADFVIQPIKQGYEQFVGYGRAAGQTIGQGNVSDVNFARAQALAFDKTETIGQAHGVARATGQLGAVGTAQESARFFGGSVEETTGLMGSLTRGGQGFNNQGGGAGRTQMFRMLRDATASGLDRSRVGEHLEAVSSAIESTGQSLAGDVNASQISGLLAMIGSTGRSGFQGARGMNVLSQVDQGIKSGGRDEYSQAMQLAAFGFGVPGRDTDYFTARGRMEQGIFGEGGDRNLIDTINQYRGMTGNRQEQILGMQESGSFGNLTQSQISGLMDAVDSSGGDLSSVQSAIDNLRSSQGSIEEQIRDNLKTGQATVAQRIVDLNNRLTNIGERSFDAMANMQDAVIALQDNLLPTAIRILDTISSVVTDIRNAIPGFAQTQTDVENERIRAQGYNLMEQVNQATTLAQAQVPFNQLRQLEREVDSNEHRLFREGNTADGSRAYHLGEQLAGAESMARNHIRTLENIRDAEARAAQAPQPTPTQAPTPVQVNVRTGPTNVNVPGAQPNSMRDPVPTTGGIYENYN